MGPGAQRARSGRRGLEVRRGGRGLGRPSFPLLRGRSRLAGSGPRRGQGALWPCRLPGRTSRACERVGASRSAGRLAARNCYCRGNALGGGAGSPHETLRTGDGDVSCAERRSRGPPCSRRRRPRFPCGSACPSESPSRAGLSRRVENRQGAGCCPRRRTMTGARAACGTGLPCESSRRPRSRCRPPSLPAPHAARAQPPVWPRPASLGPGVSPGPGRVGVSVMLQ